MVAVLFALLLELEYFYKEVLVYDHKKRKERVHAYLVAVPVHKRRDRKQKRCKKADALVVGERTQKVRCRNAEYVKQQRHGARCHYRVAKCYAPEVQKYVIQRHVHVFGDKGKDVTDAAPALPEALRFVEAQTLSCKEKYRKCNRYAHQNQEYNATQESSRGLFHRFVSLPYALLFLAVDAPYC